MKQMPISAVGMVWYQPEDYAAIKALMKDGDSLPASHAEWLQRAEQGERKLSGDGQLVVRANLEPEPFRQFCLERGLDVDANGRLHYASWVAMKEQRNGG